MCIRNKLKLRYRLGNCLIIIIEWKIFFYLIFFNSNQLYICIVGLGYLFTNIMYNNKPNINWYWSNLYLISQPILIVLKLTLDVDSNPNAASFDLLSYQLLPTDLLLIDMDLYWIGIDFDQNEHILIGLIKNKLTYEFCTWKLTNSKVSNNDGVSLVKWSEVWLLFIYLFFNLYFCSLKIFLFKIWINIDHLIILLLPHSTLIRLSWLHLYSISNLQAVPKVEWISMWLGGWVIVVKFEPRFFRSESW